MISADVFVATREAPGNRETRHKAAGEALGLMRLEHSRTDAIHVEPMAGEIAEVTILRLALAPLTKEEIARGIEVFQQSGARLLSGLGRVRAAGQRDHEASVNAVVNLKSHCDVAIGRMTRIRQRIAAPQDGEAV